MQMVVWGEPPWPPASPGGAVVVVVVPISTGGLCWKMLEMQGTAKATSPPPLCHCDACSNTLGSYTAMRRRERTHWV